MTVMTLNVDDGDENDRSPEKKKGNEESTTEASARDLLLYV